jgi:DNA repair protein RadC
MYMSKAVASQVGLFEDFEPKTKQKSVNVYSLRMVKESTATYQANPVKGPREAYMVVNQIFDLENMSSEHFVMVCMDTKNKLAGAHIISIGSLDSAIVHPREVFKAAILNNASGIILLHNHPSGDPEPSREDIETTQRLITAGTILGIKVVDHVVVGEYQRYISFKEQGLL